MKIATAFFSQNLICNLINYSTSRRKTQRKAHTAAEKQEHVENATAAPRHVKTPKQSVSTQPCHTAHCIWYRYTFLNMLSRIHVNPVWPSSTLLNLTSISVELFWYVGHTEFQLLANNFDNTKNISGRVE